MVPHSKEVDFSNKVACIIDNGLFVCMAELLARSFGKVYYATSTGSSFPSLTEYSIGEGIPNVHRLTDTSSAYALKDEIDLWVFPDLYSKDLQEALRSEGVLVWGSGAAEDLELDRLKFKQWAKKAGLDVGPYEVIKGMDALEEKLRRRRKPGFVKTARKSLPRGDWETLRFKSYDEIRFKLLERRQKLWHKADSAEFILEEPIDDAIEAATDIYNVRGQFPGSGLFGLEMKAECYLGKVVDYEDYPLGLREVNEALESVFRKAGCCNLSPIECRITEGGKTYVLDPCLRFGRPPLCIQLAIKNWAEIMWHGASGELIEPDWSNVWFAEMCLYSDTAETLPEPVIFDAKYLPNVRLSNYCIESGEVIVVPQHYKLSGIGSVCAGGKTMDEAIANVRKIASEIVAYDCKPADAFNEAEKTVSSLKKYGITI